MLINHFSEFDIFFLSNSMHINIFVWKVFFFLFKNISDLIAFSDVSCDNHSVVNFDCVQNVFVVFEVGTVLPVTVAVVADGFLSPFYYSMEIDGELYWKLLEITVKISSKLLF